MQNTDTKALAYAVPALLFGLLVYSQIGWRKDQRSYQRLRAEALGMKQRTYFPIDGGDITTSKLNVVRGKDTLPLARLVSRRHRNIVYFTRPTCPSCQWFARQMDSLLPSWRDSMLVVTSWGDSIGPVTGLTLDSASARIMTGVPALLVIDSTGSVRHSVSGGLPMMIRVLNFVRFPAPAESLLYIKTDTTDQQSANRARAAILNAGHRLR